MGFFIHLEHMISDLTRLRHGFVNLYFCGNADSWVLVDAGLPGSAGTIIRMAERRFGKGTKPKAIILTHGHFDHVGAFPGILEKWDVPVYAHRLEMPYLTGQASYPPPDPFAGSGLMALMSFMFPRKGIDLDRRAHALPMDGSVPFMPGWRWIHTPGHTEGHISLFRDSDRILIAGDAFITTKQESFLSVLAQKPGIFGPPSYFTPDWGRARESVNRLASLRPSIAATGHGPPLQGDDMRKELERLAINFDRLALPKRGRYRATRFNASRRSIESEEADWLHEKLDRSGEQSPDLAAAPMGTDQEAGGAITTPSGRRKYAEGDTVTVAFKTSRTIH